MSQPPKKRGILSTLKNPQLVRYALAISGLLLWYSSACRVSEGPFLTLPLAPLSYPRRDGSWLCALALCILTALVVAALRHLSRDPGNSASPLPRSRMPRNAPLAAGALLCAAGTAIVVLGSSSAIASMAGGGLAGTGFALECALLFERVRQQPSPQETALVGAASLALAATVSLALAPLPAPVAHVVVCALPLACALCVPPAREVPGADDKRTPRPTTERPTRARTTAPDPLRRVHAATLVFCFLGIGLFLGIIGFSQDAMSSGDRSAFHLLTAAGGGAVAAVVWLGSHRLTPDGPHLAAPILLGTAALALPFFGTAAGSGLANVFGKAADDLAFVLAALFLVRCAAQGASKPCNPGTRHAGRATAPLFIAALAALALTGILLGGVFVSVIGQDASSLALVAASLVYLAMLALALMAKRKSQDSYIIVRNPGDVARIATAQAQAIAQEFPDLSAREIDVLDLLLQHQSIDGVAQRLGVSRNTIKSHIAHLYAKTGVASRQQLIDLAASKTIEL